MAVYETNLPGVGRKFDLELSDDTFASVVVHHDGRCELYRRPNRETSGEKLLELTGDEANKLRVDSRRSVLRIRILNELSVPFERSGCPGTDILPRLQSWSSTVTDRAHDGEGPHSPHCTVGLWAVPVRPPAERAGVISRHSAVHIRTSDLAPLPTA